MRTVNSTTVAQETIKYANSVLKPALASGALTQREALIKLTEALYQHTRSGCYQVWGYDIPFGRAVSMASDNSLVSFKIRNIGAKVLIGEIKTRGGFTQSIRTLSEAIFGLELVIKADGQKLDFNVLTDTRVEPVDYRDNLIAELRSQVEELETAQLNSAAAVVPGSEFSTRGVTESEVPADIVAAKNKSVS